VAKVFRGKKIDVLYAWLKQSFDSVTCAKPSASRNSSYEGFVVCQGYNGRLDPEEQDALAFQGRLTVPFVACGDEEKMDSDRSYSIVGDVEVKPNPQHTDGDNDKDKKKKKKNKGKRGPSSPSVLSSAGPPSSSSSSYQYIQPLAMPIDPPYQRALKQRKLK
jgi:hypothetical protein